MASPSANQHLLEALHKLWKDKKQNQKSPQPIEYKSKVTDAEDSYLQKISFYNQHYKWKMWKLITQFQSALTTGMPAGSLTPMQYKWGF